MLRSDGGASPLAYGSIPTPWGFAARYSPRDLDCYWMEVVALSAGRTGVLLGCCEAAANNEQLRSDALAALVQTADPVQSLSGMATSKSSGVCAVIDRDSISYSGHGNSGGVIVAAGAAPEILELTDGRLAVAQLDPGATVLLCSGPVGTAVSLLDDCAATPPEQLADRVILGLGGADAGCATVLYRHPPEPLSVTLPAAPESLSVSRGKLRAWLAASGLDAETCADILLAVGEATANATEHAVVGASGPVAITMDARFEPGALLLSVSDNGQWKPASSSNGHRGHGIHLMNALVNSVELTTAPQGTTVTMVKDLPR